jgi:hypothetical protein
MTLLSTAQGGVEQRGKGLKTKNSDVCGRWSRSPLVETLDLLSSTSVGKLASEQGLVDPFV